jgi:hypothetical protein
VLLSIPPNHSTLKANSVIGNLIWNGQSTKPWLHTIFFFSVTFKYLEQLINEHGAHGTFFDFPYYDAVAKKPARRTNEIGLRRISGISDNALSQDSESKYPTR